jgi:hypothetical protein
MAAQSERAPANLTEDETDVWWAKATLRQVISPAQNTCHIVQDAVSCLSEHQLFGIYKELNRSTCLQTTLSRPLLPLPVYQGSLTENPAVKLSLAQMFSLVSSLVANFEMSFLVRSSTRAPVRSLLASL